MSPRDTAVLICPPFGWEDVCSYRARRDWAGQLASVGYATLRIDLPSTGDSGGSPEDPDRLAAWIDAVSSAARWLSSAAASSKVATIGIGLGGLLSCAAVADGAPIDELVLWNVPSRGKTFVRELRAFERMESSKFAPSGERGHAPLADGTVGAGGFVLSPETAQALEALDLASLELPDGRARRALLLERDGIGVDQRLREHLQQAGVAVRVAAGPGYGAMMAEPQEARAPAGVFASVDAWLAEAAAGVSPSSVAHRATDDEGASDDRSRATPAQASPPGDVVEHRDTAELLIDGALVREAPLSIELPCGRLFGILAEPAEGATQDLGVVLLNAGAIRRIGPNRMWVEMARRWAARGVPSLRLDLEGLGDADGDAARVADVAEFYVPGLVAQVRSALDVLQARGTARHFALSGLCSGAYWSFHGALQDERVVAAFMLNPRTLFWDAALENVRYVRRGLLKPSSWRMILQGDVRLARVGSVARAAPRSLLRRAIARWRSHGDVDQLDRALDRLHSMDKHLLFVFSENEPLHEELTRQGRLGHVERWPNLALELLPGRDHTLRPAHSQQRAHDALDRALENELARVFS